MRARLLDLGEVGPVRSQSAFHAVLAGIGADDDPFVFLLRPAAPFVSIGDSPTPARGRAHDPVGEIDLEACLDQGIPLVWCRIGGAPEILDENDLLIQVVIPIDKTSSEAVAVAPVPALETLAGLGVAAESRHDGSLETDAGRIGHVQAAVIDSALCVTYSLTWRQRSSALPARSSSSLEAQMEEPLPLPDLAERLLVALERHFSLDLFPSLPTPGELEAIYDWDRRLLIETVEEASIKRPVMASQQ